MQQCHPAIRPLTYSVRVRWDALLREWVDGQRGEAADLRKPQRGDEPVGALRRLGACTHRHLMSAFGGKADMTWTCANLRL